MIRSIEWAAGLFEGEGYSCKSFDKRRNKNYYKVGIEMSDKDCIDDFEDTMGFGKRYYREREGKKPTWTWTVGSKKAIIKSLELLLPHLGLRRAYNALNILDDLELAQ